MAGNAFQVEQETMVLMPPGHRGSVSGQARTSSGKRTSVGVSSGRRRQSNPQLHRKPGVDPVKYLPSLLRNVYPVLDEDFARDASRSFRARAGFAPGARLGFDDTVAGLRALGLEEFVDGASDDSDVGRIAELGDGADARRQLRLWCGPREEFGVTDEPCFVWIAYRGKRFIDLAKQSRFLDMFNKLGAGRGVVSLSDLDSALAANETGQDPAWGISFDELRADVKELFGYHVGRRDSIDFAEFVALICDIQDRSVLGQLSLSRASPVQCVLRRDRGATFLRPLSASDFAPQRLAV